MAGLAASGLVSTALLTGCQSLLLELRGRRSLAPLALTLGWVAVGLSVSLDGKTLRFRPTPRRHIRGTERVARRDPRRSTPTLPIPRTCPGPDRGLASTGFPSNLHNQDMSCST